MIGRLKAQIVKELLSMLRDPRSRATLIGPPLLQLFIFSYAVTLDVTNVTIAVLDEESQEIENPGLKQEFAISETEFSAAPVELEVTESVEHERRF